MKSSRFQTSKSLILLTLLVMLWFACAAVAQETTAGFQGTVKDPTGAVVGNATLEVSSPALIGTRKVSTDEAGNYRFAALPPGRYILTVTATGFRTYKQAGIDLTAGRLPNIDVRLEVGAIAETIEVAEMSPIVDTTTSKVAVTVQREVLDNIPKGRSFQSVIPFAPGARQEPLQSVGRGTNGFQIDGASDGENVYLIDGVNTTNIQNGGVGKDFQMEFVKEVQIKSSSFEAEHGGALGGVINAIPQSGSNDWHGEMLLYFRSNALNANDGDRGLRANPNLPARNNTTRTDVTPEYYMARKDQRTIIEPGFKVGGPLYANKLWIFSSYIPEVDTTRRTTNFKGSNPGPRTLTQTSTTHNMYNRLDYGVLDSLRLYGAWNYGYYRTTGQLGGQDSVISQTNTGATTDPNTFRSDSGSVNPRSLYTFGGDWTPTAKVVVSARYGYFFQNSPQRGVPEGTRYLYQTTINASSRDLAGNPFPSSSFNTSGYANIPNNLATVFDAYKRKSFNIDASYFAGAFGGTHTFKGGYFWQQQSNDVLRTFQGGRVNLYWGSSYEPVTSTTACDQVKTQNQAQYGQALCQGLYGYFVVGTTVTNTGTDTQTAHALYIQDNWTVGKGLTLNLGIRFDKETQPPYDPKRFPTVSFGWGDKIAPRIGGAYDVLRKGKVKIYASYGKFFDIMKMGLARGSFGSDYWHDCVYAMDSTAFTSITPTYPLGGGCPATGPAPGVNVGRFIENVDFRATKADPRDPAISPNMKPMEQHEIVIGVDWAIAPNWSLETRYARKRLDRTIEDMAITDNLGFYIGNPGTTFADVLHRPLVIPDDNGNEYLTSVPFCAECPPTVGAIRRYDGLELRLAKRPTGNWFGAVTYTYSRLKGNYAGLTNTDPTDGSGGRHSPNNHRGFDIPTMTYLPNGQIDDGPLSTDRPHTASLYGYYTLRWAGMRTNLGFTQSLYQGSAISTCLPVIGTSSACQWAEGRGNFVKLTRAANGDIVKGDVVQDARSDPFFQTDINLHHEIVVRENRRIGFEANLINLFNHRASVAYSEFAVPNLLINPTRPKRFSGDLGVDWAKVMKPYNYIDALNGAGAFAGVQTKLTMASFYGMPNVFQQARTIRLAMRFVF
jgi:outer membrane receptor protein involved in Fe transport